MVVKQVLKKVTKKDYTTPTLKVYGKLKDLTVGGSGKAFEGNQGTTEIKKRP